MGVEGLLEQCLGIHRGFDHVLVLHGAKRAAELLFHDNLVAAIGHLRDCTIVIEVACPYPTIIRLFVLFEWHLGGIKIFLILT